MALPHSGVPRIVTGLLTASAESALAVLSVRDNWTPGELCAAILREVDGFCAVYIHPATGLVLASSDALVKDAWQDMADGYSPRLVVSPDAPGLLAKWSVVASVDFADVSGIFHASNKHTLSKLIARFVEMPNIHMLANQDNSQLAVFSDESDFAGRDAAIAGAGLGDTLAFELRAVSVSRLAFE